MADMILQSMHRPRPVTGLRAVPFARRGFSAVELVLVLLILAIFAAMALPRIGGANERYKARLAATRLAADINDAFAASKRQSGESVVRIPQRSMGYAIERPDRTGIRVNLGADPYGAYIGRTGMVDGSDAFRITGYGEPSTTGRVQVVVGGAVVEVVIVEKPGRAIVGDATGKSPANPTLVAVPGLSAGVTDTTVTLTVGGGR